MRNNLTDPVIQNILTKIRHLPKDGSRLVYFSRQCRRVCSVNSKTPRADTLLHDDIDNVVGVYVRDSLPVDILEDVNDVLRSQ